MNDELLSFAAAGKHIGISRAGVWSAVQRNLIATEQYGPHQLIKKSEAERYKKERRPPGRPRLSK